LKKGERCRLRERERGLGLMFVEVRVLWKRENSVKKKILVDDSFLVF